MIKIKNINCILIILFIISISVNFLAWQKFDNSSNFIENKEVKVQELELIENEYTKDLNKLPDGWNIYSNEKYNFKINYPEEFENKEVEIKKVSFSSREDFYSTGKYEQVSTVPSGGNFKTAKHMIDFNITEDKMIENQIYKIKSPLFTIVVHSNKSNLSFEDFVSQEILNFYEGNERIKDQRIIKINNIEGYRFIYYPIPGKVGIVYYLPSQDNKTIFSISTEIILLDEILRSDDPYFEFSKINPQYQKEFYNTKNPVYYEGHSEFLKKYPDYEKFLNHFSFKHTKKELNKRLIFEKIVYSFKFN